MNRRYMGIIAKKERSAKPYKDIDFAVTLQVLGTFVTITTKKHDVFHSLDPHYLQRYITEKLRQFWVNLKGLEEFFVCQSRK